MAKIRSYSDIVQGLLSYFKQHQPLLTLQPGAVSRDLFVEGVSYELQKLYSVINDNSRKQSLRLSIGSDIDKWATNIGALRQRGAKATGAALLTFNSLEADLGVRKGDLFSARNGATFSAVNNLVISPVLESSYKATVAKYRADLDYLNNSDTYAVEILTEATSPGEQANISKYNLSSTTIAGIAHVTNVKPFGGGKNAESDASFKNRLLAIFSGANTGTALGYKNTVENDPGVITSVVITPGDPLMTRDGTQVSTVTKITETPTILSEGTGGKADIVVFGRRLQESVDTFIYQDKSNKDDPTNSANDFVLGQIAGDSNKTVTLKRISNLENKTLPAQPVNNLVSVVGSGSGANFKPYSIDSLGRVSGNYKLVKDTGAYKGSPWGFDKLTWINDHISDFPEDKSKISFNGQDTLTYSDVSKIGKVIQNIAVTNENSTVSPANRTSIQLKHFPSASVTRVFNVTTGERYVVSNQNPDGSGSINLTGRILITGSTLPAVSDKLQVDYTWVYSYDPYFDFDNKEYSFNIRSVTDSLDWGYSNAVRREESSLATSGSYLTATVTHPISAVVSVNVFLEEASTITILSSRISCVVASAVTNVISIKRSSDGAELWNTINNDGNFNGLAIYLPTDTIAQVGDGVTVFYNAEDVYNTDSPGNFNSNVISVTPSSTAVFGTVVEVNYFANVSSLLPATLLSNLPALRSGNYFATNSSSQVGNQPTSHLFSEDSIVQNLRMAPSKLSLNLSGLNSITESGGIFAVTGTSISYAEDIVFTASANGLTQDLSSAARKFLKLSSIASISSNVKIGRLVKMEKVTTDNNLNVLDIVHDYDILGYKILDNSFVKDEAIADLSLSKMQVSLPETVDNNDNLPQIGDRLRVRFYLTTSSDTELISFTKSGTQVTNKTYLLVDTIAISSGFTSSTSAGAILTISNFNQPVTKSRYKTYYDYLAPKINERITVTFNYNKMISDSTLLIEDVRPVNADVIVKEDTVILVDVTLYIIVTPEMINSSATVRQNVIDAVSSALNVRTLGATVDSSDLENVSYSVNGVDRVRTTYFNVNGSVGSVLSISVRKDQSIAANNVLVYIESR